MSGNPVSVARMQIYVFGAARERLNDRQSYPSPLKGVLVPKDAETFKKKFEAPNALAAK
jgi:hypothetical protein